MCMYVVANQLAYVCVMALQPVICHTTEDSSDEFSDVEPEAQPSLLPIDVSASSNASLIGRGGGGGMCPHRFYHVGISVGAPTVFYCFLLPMPMLHRRSGWSGFGLTTSWRRVRPPCPRSLPVYLLTQSIGNNINQLRITHACNG